ncbi:hypothetical protein [Silvanigrella aquatica]|uniref:DUF58 domain-containing protein n=1 Tax=Silvanigrella aquatica TaxID=1915309 RepID=A0A1L4D026_9BACT|nr:hypothetical protein [Silvanigrella aquatica]APJ03563.1 hypothetical protein AXG55_06435 [Silvanigrella aquatica]
MNFETICEVFPKEEKYWPCPNPSRALPFFIKSYLRQNFGGILAANDLYKKNEPSRLGVATRQFELGDPISTLSKNHFIKTQDLFTRVDYGAGRQSAVVIFHSYKNMTYQSEFSGINKGQLAHGITALLEEIHKGLSHSFKIINIPEIDLFEGCKYVGKHFLQADFAYFISDLLFDSRDVFASANRALEIIQFFHIKKSIFIIARDPMEYPDENIKIEELMPWEQFHNYQNSHYFSGKNYRENIQNQIKFLDEKLKEKEHYIKVVQSKQTIVDFIDFILKDIFRKK